MLLSARAEPKLTVLRPLPVVIDKLEDENGQGFEIPPPRRFDTGGGAGPGAVWFIKFPPRPGVSHRIGQIHGVAPALVELANDRRLVKGTIGTADQPVDVGGLPLVVGEILARPWPEQKTRKLRIVIQLRNPPEGKKEREAMFQLLGWVRVGLFDADKHPMLIDYANLERPSSKQPAQLVIDTRCMLRDSDNHEAAEPASLQLIAPTRAAILKIPFEFHDIPIIEAKHEAKQKS
jgi:hypothetical protein